MFKRSTRMLAICLSLISLLVIIGCASVGMGKSKYPQPTAGFVPKRIYDSAFDVTWRQVQSTLESQRIGIASSDKQDGRILTEYTAGETKMLIGILGAAGYTTRYKFSIIVERLDPSKTRVGINATLESSETAGSGTWRDHTKDLPEVVASLENWLYEKFETSGIAPSTLKGAASTTTAPIPGPMSTSEMQRCLIAAGYVVGAADGVFGNRSVAALKAFQKDNGLSVTGELNDATTLKLRKYMSSK